MFAAHQQDVLCHLRTSEVVCVHTKKPVDDVDRVVTINQVEGVVDDLPQVGIRRARVRTLQRISRLRRSIVRTLGRA